MVGKGKQKRKEEETKKVQPKRPPNSPYNLPFLWIGRSEADPLLSLSAIRSTEYPIRTQISIRFMFHLFFYGYFSDTYPSRIHRVPVSDTYRIRNSHLLWSIRVT